MALRVGFAAAAATQFAQMKARAEASPDSAHATVWDAMKQILDVLTQERWAFARSNGCRLGQHDFGNVFRLKFGRNRVFYIGSTKHQRVTVLFVGFRKEGDKNDAYAELSRRLKTREFDQQFAELGVKKPKG